jgi:peptidoglycan hydrolase-like protein with peptidoglycan-binding domain
MPAQTLLWNDPVEITASGNVGGLIHYFTEEAQAFFLAGTDMATKLLDVPEGQYGVPGDIVTVEDESAYSAMRLDHPAFGIVFASWASGGNLVFALYNYAADVSNIIESCEVTEQNDNAIKGLEITVKNSAAALFEGDMSLFSPGAALAPAVAYGDSEWYPMGKYYLDSAPWDPLRESLSFQGRSRIGRLLKDNTFDTYGSSTQAIFTGTPAQICTAIILRYSDGRIKAPELVIQSLSNTYTAKFDPQTGVLQGLTDWLRSFSTPASSSYPTLNQGDTGDNVKTAQRLLNSNMAAGATKLSVDGDFGPKTLDAVKAYQKEKELTVSGTVDSATWSALLNTPTANWELVELFDGRIVIGNAAWIAKYRAVGRYTFTRNQDVITRSISRSMDGAYSRVGVKYSVTSGDTTTDAYAYANIDTYPAWAVPSHRTHYIDAPDGSTATQAKQQAESTATELQFVGITEQLLGFLRPELLVGDIAQISDDGGSTATVTGVITEVRHRWGEQGFFTSFDTDSGGSVMDIDIDDEETGTTTTVTVTKPAKPPSGGNRRRRVTDAVKKIIKPYTLKGKPTIWLE